MNFVYLSPHFPPNYYQFCVHLRNLGATVLGIGDEPYDQLRPELKAALNEYYWVPNMHLYDDLMRGLGYFIHHYGRIDRLDSHAEYWLETEARLRTDFNIPGLHEEDIPSIKRKSLMKAMYRKAGVETAPGAVIRSRSQARRFAREVGYPVIAKPDIGVGAAQTYRFDDEVQLDVFLETMPSVDYYLEKFITGTIQTFDGLTDNDGDIVFSSSMQYSRGIMEAVNEDSDLFYYITRTIPQDVEIAGRALVKAYGIRQRFFHFEFFRTPENKVVGLEVNMRPPGGLTTDMFNYANNIDIYYEWANVIVHNRFTALITRPYHCIYINRKWNNRYIHPNGEILKRYGEKIVFHTPIPDIFSNALGNYGYIARSPDLNELFEMAAFIQEKVR